MYLSGSLRCANVCVPHLRNFSCFFSQQKSYLPSFAYARQLKKNFHRAVLSQRHKEPIKLEKREDSFFTLKQVSVNALGDNFNVIYAHAGPKHGDVVIMVHGSPASHKGFQNMAEPLVANGYQVIVPNLPGMGWTPMPTSGCYNFSMRHKAAVFQGLVEALKIEKVLMFCGHSMGCHVILHFAFLPDFMSKCQSVCLISSIGFRPHRLAAPFFFKRFVFRSFYNLCQIPILGPYLTNVTDPMFLKLGLKGKTKEAQVNSVQEASFFDFKSAKAGADIFRQRKMPVLSIGGSKDKLVQFDITQELVSELGISDENIAWYKKDTGRDSQDFSDDQLQRGVFIKGGDHSVFTNRVDAVTPEQLSFLKAVKKQNKTNSDEKQPEGE